MARIRMIHDAAEGDDDAPKYYSRESLRIGSPGLAGIEQQYPGFNRDNAPRQVHPT